MQKEKIYSNIFESIVWSYMQTKNIDKVYGTEIWGEYSEINCKGMIGVVTIRACTTRSINGK